MKKPERPKVFTTTYGCQMNVLDSELVQGQLAALGYGFTEELDEAGVVLINTCSVRELSEQKVWSQLGRLGIQKRKKRGNLVIGVLGCMAEREAKALFARAPQVDLVCGPSMLNRVATLVDNAVNNRGDTQQAFTGHPARRSGSLEVVQKANHETDGIEALDLSRAVLPLDSKFQAYVRITRGCNKFCSFCVVPYTRGPEVHRPPEHVVDEVRRLVDAGAREVTLLGQTINHYRYASGGKTTSFADLLARVHDDVPQLARLRFLTSYPRDFSDEALDVMAESPRIVPYLHVPAQSGSNAMLKAMNRGYRVEEYDAFLEKARARIPDLRVSGDMIVGFPGESDEDHRLSVELLRRSAYSRCFIFKYSSRPGTASSRRFEDSVPEAVKKIRNAELLEVQAEMSLAAHRARVGKIFEVLVESETRLRHANPSIGNARLGWSKPKSSSQVRLIGRTVGDELVAFDGPRELIGSLVKVESVDATPLTLLARRVDPPKDLH